MYVFGEHGGWCWPMKIQCELQMLALFSSRHNSKSEKEPENYFLLYIWLKLAFKKLFQPIINLIFYKNFLLYFLLSLKSHVILSHLSLDQLHFKGSAAHVGRCYHPGQHCACQYLVTWMLDPRKALKIYARCWKNIHCNLITIIFENAHQ